MGKKIPAFLPVYEENENREQKKDGLPGPFFTLPVLHLFSLLIFTLSNIIQKVLMDCKRYFSFFRNKSGGYDMILSFDRVGKLLDEMAEEFPPEFFEELSGGILLEAEKKEDPDCPGENLYLMGEFFDDLLGRRIVLYYGSFAALAKLEEWTEWDWAGELYTTLAHELTHHMEGRAGLRDLEVKDEEEMEAFRRERGK